jgi:Tfp pilus assembly protein PilN
MIKINLLAERKPTKTKSSPSLRIEGGAGARQLMLVGIVLVGVVVAGWMWWSAKSAITRLEEDHRAADAELIRLEEVRKKGDEFTARKELLERKIQLITELKKRQQVPVHILDQVSRNLPDFLWLESMSANTSDINIAGKATTYNAVSNFYRNLSECGYFQDVTLGRTYEVSEGVSFSLTAKFVSPADTAIDAEGEHAENAEDALNQG